MDGSHILLLFTSLLTWFCIGILSVLMYHATYLSDSQLDGNNVEKLDKKWLRIIPIPSLIACLMMLLLFVKHPETCPMGMIYLILLIAIGILYRSYQPFLPIGKPKPFTNKSSFYVSFPHNKDTFLFTLWILAGLVLAFLVSKTMLA